MESTLRQTVLTDPDLRVIETMRWDGERVVRLDRHLARAAGTCAALGFRFERVALLRKLSAISVPEPLRVRVLLNRNGEVDVTTAPLSPSAPHWQLALSPQRLDPEDPWLRHKTTHRSLYDRTRAEMVGGTDEVIFLNRNGDVCEGTITNVFFDLGDGLRTPPVACGVLPGVLRAELLEQGACREEILPFTELPGARLWVGNSLRGLIPARLALETEQSVPHKQA